MRLLSSSGLQELANQFKPDSNGKPGMWGGFEGRKMRICNEWREDCNP